MPKKSRKSGALIYPELLGPPRPVAGDLHFFTLMITVHEDRYTFLIIFHSILLIMVSDKSCRENQKSKPHFVFFSFENRAFLLDNMEIQ